MRNLVVLISSTFMTIVFNIRILYLAKKDNYSESYYWFSSNPFINIFVGIVFCTPMLLIIFYDNFSYPVVAFLIFWLGIAPLRIFLCYKNFLRTDNFKDLLFITVALVLIFLPPLKV